MPKKLTKEDFINRSIAVHGDKYDYSLVDYKNRDTNVKIICPIHGIFEQTPHNHMNGAGCYKCGREVTKNKLNYTKEDFIRVSNEKHNNKYDYSLVEYKTSQDKVKIICPIHGVFEQKANNHMSGYGCKKCANVENALKQRKTTEQFIEESKKIHGDKYDYSKTKYIKLTKKVCIICPKHGEFWQLPGNHLHGWGCKKCSQSHLEIEVSNALKDSGIQFEYEKEFDWLKYEQKMSLDFYIPDKKIAIECQGSQHYFPGNFGSKTISSLDLFNLVLKRDAEKKKQCNEHGIKILYYTHENILKTDDTFTDITGLLDIIKMS